MSEQRANVPSYIERLRKPGGLPPFIQREVADILEWQVAEIKRLQARVEALEGALSDLIERLDASGPANERLRAALLACTMDHAEAHYIAQAALKEADDE